MRERYETQLPPARLPRSLDGGVDGRGDPIRADRLLSRWTRVDLWRKLIDKGPDALNLGRIRPGGVRRQFQWAVTVEQNMVEP